ncbi:hypothetical protein BCR44DRAFT_1263370 [Catenaria anguillulae PL171]|uniref:Uncharacterized protein n=1 Tax=Catenaria anguillulae PL171 TaxID=765915 RepID=A0A1Y2HC77_9FUNG|nr:hypothetical protein BCR44DRAFT_1263370 [Catenaria anguillulae PL171]
MLPMSPCIRPFLRLCHRIGCFCDNLSSSICPHSSFMFLVFTFLAPSSSFPIAYVFRSAGRLSVIAHFPVIPKVTHPFFSLCRLTPFFPHSV